MRSLSVASIARAATAVLALAACSKQPQAASGNHGSVKLAFQTLGQQQSALPLPQLCATFTIAQYSIDPVTGAHTSAGAPVVITETAPGQTASILGCIDSGAPGVNDWGYVVTATDWTMCPGQTLDPALAAYLSAHGFATFADFAATFAPQVATSAAELDCQAGLDTDAEVSVDVSIPIESQAGYVDISVNVNTSQVIVGCKEADLDSSTGDLNYGLADSNEAAPPTLHGIIGLTQGAPLAQFDSQLHQATYTQTYAGQLAPPAAGTILLQSLMPDLATCAAGQELHGYAVPTCRTEAGTSADGTGTAYDTSALLSTVLLETSTFAAWGSLDSPTQLTFQTTSATPSTLAPGAAAVTYTGSSVHSNTLVTTTIGLANVPGCTRFDGLSASRDPGTFVVLCDTASGLGYALLTQSGGTWTATSVASISGLTGAQVACLNVFHHDSGCVDPAATPCAPPPPPACNGARTLTAIPTVNTTVEDIAIGSVTIGGTAYFFADWGAGGKLTSLDATGFHMLSDTNPGGPDHGWSGGLANLDGTLAFTAYDPDGRIRLYKYTPGDPLVTAPFVTVNTTQTGALLPTQTTIHTTQGYAIPQRGDDSSPTLFHPIVQDGVWYFAAYDGNKSEIYSYVPGQPSSLTAVSNVGIAGTDDRVNLPYLLGVNGGNIAFAAFDHVAQDGTQLYFEYTPGGPAVTSALGSFDLGNDYSLSLPRGVDLGGTRYFVTLGDYSEQLLAYTPGGSVISLSDTSGGGYDAVSDLTALGSTLYFSAHDPSGVRHIYAYTPGDALPVTTPLPELCGAACATAARPIGLANGRFLFSGLDASGASHFFTTAGTLDTPGSTAPTAALNTQANDEPYGLTAVGGTLAYAALTGTIARDLYNFPTLGGYKMYALDGSGHPMRISNTAGDGHDDAPFSPIAVGNTVYFSAVDTHGSHRLFGWTIGGATVTEADALTQLGSADESIYRLVTAGGVITFDAQLPDGSFATFQYTGHPVTPADALASAPDADNVEGRGWMYIPDTIWYAGGGPSSPLFKRRQGPAPRDTAVQYMRYAQHPNSSGGGPVNYVRIEGSGGSSGPAQYVRLATLWGAGQMANVGGIAIMSGAYIPGTSIGGLISMGPNDAYPLRPLPDLGREASEFGTDGLANVWNQPAHDRAYLGIGFLRASHAVTSSKFYEYRGSGALTQVQQYAGGNDAPSSEATVGCAVYFAADVCEGNDTYAAADYFSCRKVMRWAAP